MKSNHPKPSRRTAHRTPFERLEDRRFYSVAAAPLPVPTGSAKLTGAAVGTAGSYKSQGNTIANVFDGNGATFFDGPAASGDWAGLDLGAAETVTQVQFVPRVGWGGRMVGGVFQGSATADFSAGVVTLATVTATPATGTYSAVAVTNATAFRYVRYLTPTGGYGNVAELEFDGVVTTATPTPTPTPVSTPTPTPTPLPPPVVIVPVVPVAAVAPTPAAPTATAGATGVVLTWAGDTTGTTTGYTVERQGPTAAGFVAIGTTTAAVTRYTDATAVAGTTYAYALVGTAAGGPSAASAAVSVTTPAAVAGAWAGTDVGTVGVAGGLAVNPDGSVTVTGGGADIWNATDAFNFQSQPLVGNGSVVARVTAQSNTNGAAKSGVMIRETTNADSRNVLLALTPGAGVVLQARTATHATPSYYKAVAGKAGVWLQLQRSGNTFTGLVSADGVTWTTVGSVSIPMVNDVRAGLAVTAHDNAKLNSTTFAHAAVTSTGTAASAWSAGAVAPVARWESANVTYAGKLYVFGGLVDRNLDTTAECDVYDPAADAWRTFTTIPTGGLTHAAITVVGDTAYLAGGDGGTLSEGRGKTTTAAVLSYDFTTGLWGTLPSLPTARACGGMVNVDNHLVYFGGVNGTATADLSETLSLDLANPSAGWTAGAPMPNARDHMGAAVINGVVYAVGGTHLYQQTTGNDAEVDAYDPATNVWTRVASLPIAWGSLETSTQVIDGKIVVVGGQTNGGYDGLYLNAVAAYDPTTNAWATVATLPEAVQSCSVAYVAGQLIVTGGTVDNLGGWAQSQTWIEGGLVV